MFFCVLKTPSYLLPAFIGTRAQLEKHNKVLWRKWCVEEVYGGKSWEKIPVLFSCSQSRISPLSDILLLAERSKTASTAFNSRDQPSSTPAAYFPIKLLVVLLDICSSALGIPLKRNLCKAWDWCVCKPKHGLRAYTHKGDSGTPHPQKELPG